MGINKPNEVPCPADAVSYESLKKAMGEVVKK
jgi:hypothetical protein